MFFKQVYLPSIMLRTVSPDVHDIDRKFSTNADFTEQFS